MIHQRKISTELGGGMLNLEASLDSDIDYEFFDSRGITRPEDPCKRKQRYRSNLTMRQCASINLQPVSDSTMRQTDKTPGGRPNLSCRKTRSYTQGINIPITEDPLYADSDNTTAVATGSHTNISRHHGKPVTETRSALDVITETPESRADNHDQDQEDKDEAQEDDGGREGQEDNCKEADGDHAPLVAGKTSSSPDIRDSRNRLDSVSTSETTLTNSMSCLSLLDNGMRARYVEKRFKNGTRHSMSFSNERFREIERVNQILLRKIMDKKRSHPVLQPSPRQQRFTEIDTRGREKYLESHKASAEINRKRIQKKIDMENAHLDRRIRTAKPVTKTRR